MNRKNYFNFLAFRKGLYDIDLSERAKVIYMHLLQKSSAKGSDEVELTKSQIAADLGILSKKRDALAPKNVQRALDELEEHGYLSRWQKYKGEAVPLTIKLNLDEEFLRHKRQDGDTSSDNNEQPGSEKPSENVQPYNPSLSTSNSSLSSSNSSLSDLSERVDSEKKEFEKKKMEEKLCEEAVQEPKEEWRVLLDQFEEDVVNATTVAELDSAKQRFVDEVMEIGGLSEDCRPEVDKVLELKNQKLRILKYNSSLR